MLDPARLMPGTILRHEEGGEYIALGVTKIRIAAGIWFPGYLYAGKSKHELYSRREDHFDNFEIVKAIPVTPFRPGIVSDLSFEVKCDLLIGLLDSITGDNRS